MNIIKVIDDETIEIRKYAKPNLVFNTNEYTNDYDYCTFKETINPFVLYSEKVELENKVNKAIEYIKENSYIAQDKEINGIPLMSKRLDKCDDLLEILGGKNE